MEVVAGRAAGRTHAADLLAPGDVLASRHEDGRHVTVARGDAAAVIDFDEVAVAAAVPACAEHRAVGSSVNGGAVRAGEIDAGVHCSAGVEWVGTDAEPASERNVHLHRLLGGNCNDAVLQLVELLPAVEELLEGCIACGFKRAAHSFRTVDPGRGDSKPLQLGGSHLITYVQRLGDERGLFELLPFDTRKRAILGKAPTGSGSNELGINLLAAEGRFDEGLSLFDLMGTRFSGCGKAGEIAMGTREEAGRNKACPSNKNEKDGEEHRLNWS